MSEAGYQGDIDALIAELRTAEDPAEIADRLVASYGVGVRSLATLELFNAGDHALIPFLLPPDHEHDMRPTSIPGMGVFKGREGYRAFLEQWTDTFPTAQLELLSFYEATEPVNAAFGVIHQDIRGGASGVAVDFTYAFIAESSDQRRETVFGLDLAGMRDEFITRYGHDPGPLPGSQGAGAMARGSSRLQVGVAGAAGRMGSTTCEAIDAADDLELAARIDPELGLGLGDALEALDVVVDFTTPDAAPGNIRAAIEAGVHIVVGTSGFEHEPLREAASGGGANVLVVPNFAIGAVLMMRFAAEAAKHMPEVEIVELHHAGKLDAPSGTASRTRDLIADAGGNVHDPIHSIRLPGLVAHQEVILGGEGQTLSIRHDSIDRTSFMPGVLLAVRGVGSLPDRYSIGLELLL